MPLVNEQFWRDRLGRAAPAWSGDRWLDWEHAVVVRSALRRIWPADLRPLTPARRRHPARVVVAGCGDGRWTQWLMDEFGVAAYGADALEFPGVRERLGRCFLRLDPEHLAEVLPLRRWKPDIVVFLNSLTCVENWRRALRQAAELAPRVLAFDNFQTPTPPWLKGLPHRRPIDLIQLTAAAYEAGLVLERGVAGDVMHRRLFLTTPRWLHPAVAVVSAAIDLVAARLLRPSRARHSAMLFRRRG
jgi:SAM-dependent methyltransferase